MVFCNHFLGWKNTPANIFKSSSLIFKIGNFCPYFKKFVSKFTNFKSIFFKLIYYFQGTEP